MQITSAFVAQNVLPDYWRPIVSSNVQQLESVSVELNGNLSVMGGVR